MEISFTSSTDIVAWWGAVVATSLLLWDVYKHFSNGAKIKSNIKLNIQYSDGKIISEETVDNVKSIEREKYCHIELINIGNMPTTIMSIEATHKPTKTSNFIIGAFGKAFTEHFSKKLPHVLPPGEVWSCRMEMFHYIGIFEKNTPEIHVVLSHLNKPMVITASKATNNALQPIRRRDAAPLG